MAGALVVAGAAAVADREPGWELRVTERVEVMVGATAPLTIALAVDRGLTVSKDAAVIIDLAPDAGIAVKKQRLGRGDAVDPEADAPRFAVGVRGDAPGDHAVRLHVRFWLCGTRSCRPIDVRRVAIVAVAGASAPADAGADTVPDAVTGGDVPGQAGSGRRSSPPSPSSATSTSRRRPRAARIARLGPMPRSRPRSTPS